MDHLTIFAPIFVLWIIGFFIFNLYGKPTVAYQRTAVKPLKAIVLQQWFVALVFILPAA